MKIRIEIADKPYSIEIDAKEEEVVRRAAKIINEKIRESRKNFDAPTIDHLAMVAFNISLENEMTKERFLALERFEIDDLARAVEAELAR